MALANRDDLVTVVVKFLIDQSTQGVDCAVGFLGAASRVIVDRRDQVLSHNTGRPTLDQSQHQFKLKHGEAIRQLGVTSVAFALASTHLGISGFHSRRSKLDSRNLSRTEGDLEQISRNGQPPYL